MRRKFQFALIYMTVLSMVTVSTPAQAAPNYDGIVPTANLNVVCFNETIGSGTAVPCRTDNADVYWYADLNDPGELESDDVAALRSMLTNEYSPTDLAIHYDPTPVFDGDAETDVVFQEAEAALPLPYNDIWGIMWCNGQATAAYECDQAYVRIKSPDGFRVYGGSVACHETGHAVGLVHGNDAYPQVYIDSSALGCMTSGSNYPPSLGANNVYFINQTYS